MSLAQLLSGDLLAHIIGPSATSREGLVVFPGAFNPLHTGHVEMAQYATNTLARTVHFELSILNVEKPALSEVDCRARLAQFDSQQTVWLTRSATFVEKATLFPRATFLVGADTIRRVCDLQYYQNSSERDRSIAAIANADCRFMVFGRLLDDKEFTVLDGIELPAALLALCREVPESAFRRRCLLYRVEAAIWRIGTGFRQTIEIARAVRSFYTCPIEINSKS